MRNAFQSAPESLHDFVFRLLSIHEKRLTFAKAEGCPYDENLLYRCLLHAIFTGLKNDNINKWRKPALRKNIPYSELFWSEYGKTRTRITPNTYAFHSVHVLLDANVGNTGIEWDKKFQVTLKTFAKWKRRKSN